MTALLILPGLDGTATLHTAFIEAAAAWFDSVEVVAYPPDRPLDYAELEAISRAALPDKPFVLLGESFSGPVALSIAADPRANLRGLVLSTTFATAPVPFLRTFAPLLHAAPFPLPPLMLLSWWLYGRWATPALETALRDALRQVSPHVLRFRAAIALRVDVLARCAAIAVPVLDLRASDDKLLQRDPGKRMSAAIPRCRTVEVAGPHLLLQAEPEACARIVGEFAAGIDAGRDMLGLPPQPQEPPWLPPSRTSP